MRRRQPSAGSGITEVFRPTIIPEYFFLCSPVIPAVVACFEGATAGPESGVWLPMPGGGIRRIAFEYAISLEALHPE